MPKQPPDLEPILQALHKEVLGEGRVDLSLRDLGNRIGISARMLIHYFGSREELMTQVLDYERKQQQVALKSLIQSGLGPLELSREYFRFVTEPQTLGRLKFFYDLIAEANRNPQDYQHFLDHELVGYWNTTMISLLAQAGYDQVSWDIPSLALASARGLYLEIFAGADVEDLRRRYDLMLEMLSERLGKPQSN